MDRFQEMQIFLNVVEEGGFSAAARRLEISPASVTRAVASMEKRIGVPLLLRNTRRMSLSEVGEYFLKDCRHILEALREADKNVEAIYDASPCGLLTITAPVLFGERYISPLLARYMTQYKEVNVSSIFLDRPISMAEDDIDVAIRIGSRISSSEHVIRIGEVRQVLCASPAYLNAYGRPKRPDDLLGAVTIGSSYGQRVQEWHLASDGNSLTQQINPRVLVNTKESAINIARRGFGITMAFSYQVMEDITRGTLETILDAFQPPALPVNIVMRNDNCTSAKIRTFVDYLAKHLKDAHTFNLN